MSRKDGLYDICLVLDWNIRSRARYRGSAIFFHLIRPGYEPTAGCIAVSLKDMRRLIQHIRRERKCALCETGSERLGKLSHS